MKLNLNINDEVKLFTTLVPYVTNIIFNRNKLFRLVLKIYSYWEKRSIGFLGFGA